jgi:hypothetical protein
MGEKGQIPPPICLALILCSQVYEETVVKKFTILGTFPTISQMPFPSKVQLGLYFVITNGHGKTPIRIVMTDVHEQHPPVFEIEEELYLPDPHIVLEQSFNCPGQVFEHSGEYRLQLLSGDHRLAERKHIVYEYTGPDPHSPPK